MNALYRLSAILALGLTACSDKVSKRQFDTPMTYDQAIGKGIELPLPKGCSNVTFADYADWQAFERVIRFEAPRDVCLKHIDTVLAWENAKCKTNTLYPRSEVTSVVKQGGDTTIIPTPWFDVDKIRNGVFTGKDGSHTPQIWVDRDRGVFYYMERD